jgi:transcriptional regulator with XRE-family HTH domain
MRSKQPQRRRGIILTLQGWQKLQTAIAKAEEQENFSEKYTVQQLGNRTGLDPATISKVLDREKGVDRRTIERLFRVFSLELDEYDYDKPSLEVEPTDCQLTESDTEYNHQFIPQLVGRNHQSYLLSTSQISQETELIAANHLTGSSPQRIQLLQNSEPNDFGDRRTNFPGSPLSWESGLYVERPAIEELAYSAIAQPGALIRIKSPDKRGKTSLVNRILAYAQAQGYQIVRLNLQQADSDILGSLDRFLRWLCTNITLQLNLDSRLDDYWNSDLGSKVSCTVYLQGHVLPQIESPVVLALDEMHRIFELPHIAQDFLSMLRVWHEEGNNLAIWKQLRQVVVYATEAYTPLDLNQSPFNVGLPIELPKFDLNQAQEFALKYGLFQARDEIDPHLSLLKDLVDGHPYLLHLAFDNIVYREADIEQIMNDAATSTGIYQEHLRCHLTTLQQYPEMAIEFKKVIMADKAVELEVIPAYKLESMGLVNLCGDLAAPSCNLYRLYFREHLNQF